MTNLSLPERRSILKSFARALEREAHFLRRHPQLVWQQLYNRLRDSDAQVSYLLDSEDVRRSDAGKPPWIRMKTGFRESGALIRTLAGHMGAVHSCVISPDGSFILSGSDDDTLKVWDAADGRERFTLDGNLATWRCAISPGGSFVIGGIRDNGLKIWDSNSGAERETICDCSCWAISRDDSFIVWFDNDGVFHLRDLIAGSERSCPSEHRGAVSFCAVNPDGSAVVSVGCDKVMRVWDSATAEQTRSFNIHAERVSRFVISPDGSFAVVDGSDAIELWDLDTGEQRAKHQDDIWARALEISADSSCIVRLGNNIVRRWDADGRETSKVFLGYQYIDTCAISSDGSFVACANNDSTLTIRDCLTGAVRSTLPNAGVRACAISPDNSYLVTANGNRTLQIWDLASADRLGGDVDTSSAVTAVAICAEGNIFVAGSSSGTLTVYEASGSVRAVLAGHEDAVNDVAISRDGSFIISASDDEMVKVWDSSTGQERATLLGHYREANACAISTDSSFIVSGSSNGLLKIWDGGQLKERITIRTDSHIGACVISPDDSFIVTSHGDRTIRVWDVKSAQEVATLDPRDVTFDLLIGPTYALDISPDARYIAAGVGQAIVVWDARSHQQLAALKGHSDIVSCCAFTPNARFIVSTAFDLTLRVWAVAGGSEVCTLGLPSSAAFVAAHPCLSMILFGNELYWADLQGLDYGPIVVSPFNYESNLVVRCPVCHACQPVTETAIGEIVICSRPSCNSTLQINSFVVRNPFSS